MVWGAKSNKQQYRVCGLEKPHGTITTQRSKQFSILWSQSTGIQLEVERKVHLNNSGPFLFGSKVVEVALNEFIYFTSSIKARF